MLKFALECLDLTDDDLRSYPEVMELRDAYFRAVPEMCIERPSLITQYHRENRLLDQNTISILDKAKAYRFLLKKRKAIVKHYVAPDKYDPEFDQFEFSDRSPFAGSTTSKFKGVLLYPELFGLVMWPELHTVSKRHPNPFVISDDDANKLNFEVFPHWINNTVWEKARSIYYENQFHDPVTTDFPDQMKLFQNMVFFLVTKSICISHCIPSFEGILKFGLAEMVNKARKREAQETEEPNIQFHTASIEIMTGIIEYSKNLAAEASRLASVEKSSKERDRLKEISEIYNRVPESKPTTLREALTTIWICWVALNQESPNIGLSLGRLDQLLYPFYKADVDGKDDDYIINYNKKAVELLCFFWLKIGDHVPTMLDAGEKLFGGTGSNQAVTIGGVDKNENDAVNELTYIILKAASLLKLRDPNLAARYHPEKNPAEYIRKLSESNIVTGAIPAIYNDKSVIAALKAKGDKNHAWDYGIVGCVEPVCAGRTFGHNAAIIINLTSALELAMFQGKHRHTRSSQISPVISNPSSLKSFDEFWDIFKKQTSWLIDQATTLNDQLGRTHQNFYPTPILSTFFKGPSDNSKDVTRGGAEINFSGAAIIGFADVVDSLSAIKKWVFDLKTVSFSDLIKAINSDFKGWEPLQALLRNPSKTPKFGNDDDFADNIAVDLVKFLDQQFSSRTSYRGSNFRVGYWTMTFHAGIGSFIHSLPNGRGFGESFASGITPVSKVSSYLTKTLNSLSKLPAETLSSGAALNVKLLPETDISMMSKNLAATIDAFFGKNSKDKTAGLQIQFNVVTPDTLKAAKEEPTKWSDLLVRVSGYSAYFVDLHEPMQDEIIKRTEFVVSPGYSNV